MTSPAPAASAATAATTRPAAAAARPTVKGGLLRSVMENVEALAIAIVMALVLKYFLIEAYKIPTGSMQPGIMGDQVPGIFDRVLVNKLVYLLREPERYEVIVFKNPLWQRQNYIKRLIGLPGERVTLRNGDVFVTPSGAAGESIARKPDEVFRAVRKNLLPERDGRVELARRLEPTGSAARIEGERIVFQGADAGVVTSDGIRDGYLDGYHPKWVESYLKPSSPYLMNARFARQHLDGKNDVTDVEVAADVTPGPDARSIAFEIRESGRVHRAELAVGAGAGSVDSSVEEGEAPLEWESPGAPASIPPLPAGRTTRVSFRNVDDELVLEVDGDVVARRPYRTLGLDPHLSRKTRARFVTHVAIEGSGTFSLTDVGLWRDIHYLPDGKVQNGAASAIFTVPPGEYLVLGDNTQNSWDCRQWERATYRLEDGRTITGNYFNPGQHPSASPDSNPAVDGSTIHFRNVYGQEYLFTRDELEGGLDDPDVEAVHSFPKEFLLGKALAVFWPLPPFSPTWRLKWVR